MLAIVAALIIRFRNIVGPLIIAFMLAYLLHPLALRLSQSTRLNWRWSVNVIYLIVVILLAGILTYAGFQLVAQIQSLVEVVQGFFEQLPELVSNLATLQFSIGPFTYTGFVSQEGLSTLTEQILGYVQPLLGQVGNIISVLATSTLATLGWLLFILIISYFLLADASQASRNLIQFELPGYDTDIRRLGREFSRIWDAFLRGQLIIFILVTIAYAAMLSILGMRFIFGLALMAGLARFVPYLGPFITWTVTALVALFQGSNYFGMEPWQYTLLVLVASIVLDQIFDYLVVPRFFNDVLGVHPAALLVAAIIGANLIGVVGLVLAAPVLASLTLGLRYVLKKMYDQDPWPLTTRSVRQFELPWVRWLRQLRAWWRRRSV
jgi:predicted PurR-regulated permease PerM